MREEYHVQRNMVYAMNQTREGGGLGWQHPCHDSALGPCTLGDLFDRYAIALAVLDELEARFTPAPPPPRQTETTE